MNERYEQAQRIAELANMAPDELMEALEFELNQNEAMQQELGQIADNALADAVEAMEDAVGQEQNAGDDANGHVLDVGRCLSEEPGSEEGAGEDGGYHRGRH